MTQQVDTVWGVLGLLVTGVIGPVILWRLTGGGRQPGASTAAADQPATTPVAVPTADGRTETHDLPATLAGSVAALSATVAEMQDQSRAMRAQIDGLRRTEDVLTGWVALLHRGIEDGSIPPMPEVPPDVASRLHV